MKSFLKGLLKIAIAVGLAWFVVNQIETTDRLEVPAATAKVPAEFILGNFEGDWRSQDWVFTTVDGGIFKPPLTHGWVLHPGFFTAVRSLTLGWYLIGVTLWTLLLFAAAFRSQLLLRAAAVPVG